MPKIRIDENDMPMDECPYCGLPIVDNSMEFCSRNCQYHWDQYMEDINRDYMDRVYSETCPECEE